ncbi:hypothetical protein NH514_04780 [Pseudoalteromonas sp. ACER1]|uniref:hypothetical protein n=1 Tax=unclassified Pseudoalteromonas TaxID=194690 RepID=UPI001F1C2125|nr:MULTISPECIES: hypothetical protein [unclassified Pseudoalteromonas]MCF2846581.1 hypothetical protein [Pseudoalteromonas sp. PAST1]MCO7210052.1 hypothetical protein [Pseudoalteromonas sp. ACER1]
MDDNIKVGDWVRSYGSGIWRVHRILELNDFDIQSQTNKPRTVVFSSRFVNDSYERSFVTECCDSTFVYHLQQAELDSFINLNIDLYTKFNAYKPKSINAIYNAKINIPVSKSKSELEDLLISYQSLFLEQLFCQLHSSGLASSDNKGWTAQFVAKDHEAVDGKLVYSFSTLLTF